MSLKERLKVWYNVDDIIAIVKAKAVEELPADVNDHHPSISFTHKREKNNQPPSMDANVHNEAGSLKIGVYRKPTHRRHSLHFFF